MGLARVVTNLIMANRPIHIATNPGHDANVKPITDPRSLILRCFSSCTARAVQYQLPGEIMHIMYLTPSPVMAEATDRDRQRVLI
jgi:hypothetical protein